MKSRLRITVITIAMTVLAAATQPFAIASDSAPITSNSQSSAAKASESIERSTNTSNNLAADNIQDIAYTLQRIRQQAINIYVECTRKPVYRYELNIISLCSIPTSPLESDSNYLPLRKAWLVFFIGTMEPLVQILNETIKRVDEKTKQSNMRSQNIQEWQGIVAQWRNNIKQLNDQLDVCAALVDECSPENVAVAKSARSIDYQITQLDSILHKASKFLHDNIPAS